MSRENAQAALAQSVERRLGKAEVGGSIPLGSLQEKSRKTFKRLFYGIFLQLPIQPIFISSLDLFFLFQNLLHLSLDSLKCIINRLWTPVQKLCDRLIIRSHQMKIQDSAFQFT